MIMKMGPCGGLNGEEVNIDPAGVSRISYIGIRHGHAIYGLLVHLQRDNGEETTKFGQLENEGVLDMV